MVHEILFVIFGVKEDNFMPYVIALICMLCVDSAWADMRCSTNSLGVTTCKDSNGRVIKSRTNSLGVTTYTDQNGKKTKCRTNSVGVTRCD